MRAQTALNSISWQACSELRSLCRITPPSRKFRRCGEKGFTCGHRSTGGFNRRCGAPSCGQDRPRSGESQPRPARGNRAADRPGGNSVGGKGRALGKGDRSERHHVLADCAPITRRIAARFRKHTDWIFSNTWAFRACSSSEFSRWSGLMGDRVPAMPCGHPGVIRVGMPSPDPSLIGQMGRWSLWGLRDRQEGSDPGHRQPTKIPNAPGSNSPSKFAGGSPPKAVRMARNPLGKGSPTLTRTPPRSESSRAMKTPNAVAEAPG